MHEAGTRVSRKEGCMRMQLISAAAYTAALIATGGAAAQNAGAQNDAARTAAAPVRAAQEVAQVLSRQGVPNALMEQDRTMRAEQALRARAHMLETRGRAELVREPLRIDDDVIIGMPAQAPAADEDEGRDPAE